MSSVTHTRAVVSAAEVVTEYQPVMLGKHFKITPSGLDIVGDPSFEACDALWNGLKTLERSLQFAIGDAIRYIEGRWGEEKAAQIIDATGWSLSTVNVYRWVAKNVPSENRMLDRGLSYAHHQACAGLPAPDQKVWLTRALGDGDGEHWPVAKLKQALRSKVEVEETEWYLVVACGTEEKRENLRRELEGKGYRCKVSEKREVVA